MKKFLKVTLAVTGTAVLGAAAWVAKENQGHPREPLTAKDVRNIAIVASVLSGALWFSALA